MTTHAVATFTLDAWDQETWDDAEGATLAKARVTKTFSGDIEATSIAQLLLCTAGEGSAVYVGLERIVGSVHGRAGTFVLHHTATATGGEQSGSWTVAPESGTGELWGLRGVASISIDADGGHTFTLDYDIDRLTD